MAASTRDPITKTAMDLFAVRAKRQAAELALEKARVEEAMAGRTAVPGVIAELTQRHEKEQQRRAKIQEQGAQPKVPAQAMTPPLTDVSGQMGGRSSGQALKNASFLADVVSGGGGLKRAGVPGGVAQQSIPQAGPSAGMPAPGAAAPQGAGATPAGAAASPTLATQAVPVERQLGGAERWWNAILGAAFRSAPELNAAIRGRQVIGHTTLGEQADQLAGPLATLKSRSNALDPEVAKASREQYDQRMQQIEKEMGPEMAALVRQRTDDLVLAADEQQRIANEDPETQDRRRKAQLDLMIAEDRLSRQPALDEKLRLDIERSRADLRRANQEYAEATSPEARREAEVRRRTAEVELQRKEHALQKETAPPRYEPSPEIKKEIETTLNSSQDLLRKLEEVEFLANTEGEYFRQRFETGAFVEHKRLVGLDALNLLDAEGKRKLGVWKEIDSKLARLNVKQINDLAGKTMTPEELKRIEPMLTLITSDSPTSALAGLGSLRSELGLSIFRYTSLLNIGVKPENAPFGWGMVDTRRIATETSLEMVDTYKSQGYSQDEASAKTADFFRSNYGIDLKQLTGAP